MSLTWRLVLVSRADWPIVSLDEARAQCRVLSADHDEELIGLIDTATQWLEPPSGWLGRALRPATYRLEMTGLLGSMRLPVAPVTAVTNVELLAAGAQTFEALSSEAFALDGDCLIVRDGAPSLERARPYPVRVTLQAGYASADAVPSPIKHAVKLLVGQWFEHREASAPAAPDQATAFGVTALLTPFRWCW